MFCQTGTNLNGIISPKRKMWVLMRARPWRAHGSDMLAHGSIGPQDQQADHFLFYKWGFSSCLIQVNQSKKFWFFSTMVNVLGKCVIPGVESWIYFNFQGTFV